MITNTNRILYDGEYIPAYRQEVEKKIVYNGYKYPISFSEVKTDHVYKVELDNNLVVYLSDCEVEVPDTHTTVNVKDLKEGDQVLTYLDNLRFDTGSYNARNIVLAFSGNVEKAEELKKKFKIDNLSQYKLLRNNHRFISSFICELIRENKVSMLEEWQYLRGFFSFNMLQELMLVFSMFGIRSFLEKEEYWRININIHDFLGALYEKNNPPKKIPQTIKSIERIDQESQAFKVSCSHLVVNTIMVQGDI